jgi:ribose transport system substrate-binding protein
LGIAGLVLIAAAAPSQEGKKVRFVVMPKQLDNPVFNYARIGAMEKARELGVEIIWSAPVSNDEAKQAELLRSFIAQKVDGIAVSCTNPEILSGPINEAVAASIPVTTWDSDSPNSKRMAFYGLDDYKAGEIIAREVGEMIGGKGKVAIMTGVPDATNLVMRVKGVRDYMRKNFPDVTLLPPVYCHDDVDKAVQAVDSTMRIHPDLAAWAMVGGWPLFSASGLSSVDPGKTKVVAVDPLKEVWPWIEEGKLQVGVGQKVFDWGAKSVELLWRLHRGEKIAEARDGWFVDSGVDLVVLNPKKFPHPERYISLADYKKMFESRLKGAK